MNEEYLNELAMNFDPFPFLQKLQAMPKMALGMDPSMVPGAAPQIGAPTPEAPFVGPPVPLGAPTPAPAGLAPGGPPVPGSAAPIDPRMMAQLQSMMAPQGTPQVGGAAPQRTGPVNLSATTGTTRKPGARQSLAQLLGMK